MTTTAIVAVWAVIAGAAPIGAAPATPVVVHAQLERTVPAAGDTLDAPPGAVVLTFSGLVEETGARLTLLGPGGQTWALEPARHGSDSRTLTAALPDLDYGGFRLEWRVISADGHPIAGDFAFFLSSPDGRPLGDAPPPSAGAAALGEGRTGDDSGGTAHVSGPVAMVTRAAANLALLGLAGVLCFVAVGRMRAPSARTNRTLRSLTVAAPVLTLAYAWLWVGEVLGSGATAQARVDGLVSLASGRTLVAEVALAGLAGWALLLARRPTIAAVFAVLAVVSGGLGGHPMSYTPALAGPSNAIHLVAVAVWTGGLLLLVTERVSDGYPGTARRVSKAALVAAIAVAGTGLLQTWLIIGSPARLFDTTYGWLILVKAAGFGGLVAFGAHHRFRLVPQVHENRGARLSASVSREVVLAGAVVAVAALLSHIPPTP